MLCYKTILLKDRSECLLHSPVGERDAVKLQELSGRILSETDFISLENPLFFRNTLSEASFLELIADSSDCLLLLAEINEVPAGCACLVTGGNGQHEIGIAVRDSMSERGLGSAMLSLLIRKAKSAGIHSLFLKVHADNHRAISLYSKFGFSFYETTPSDIIRFMRLDITD